MVDNLVNVAVVTSKNPGVVGGALQVVGDLVVASGEASKASGKILSEVGEKGLEGYIGGREANGKPKANAGKSNEEWMAECSD